MRSGILSIGAILALVCAPHARAGDEPSWATSAAALVPAGYVAGLAYRTDEAAMTGYMAAFRADANDPKTPASAFDPGKSFVVKLAKENGVLKAVSGELRDRKPDTPEESEARAKANGGNDYESDFIERNAELKEKAKSLPAGTEPCAMGVWSEDKDPKGLNVRAEPNAQSKVFGTIPPPFKFKAKNKSENTPEGGWLTEFQVIGYKDGWFLIENAGPPGKEYESEDFYPKNPPKPYSGRGWVAGNKIGAQYANGSTRMGGLFQAPSVDAKWTPAKNQFGGEISADGGPKRILACSGYWALVESHDGVRGWWRSLCSNQVTNCS